MRLRAVADAEYGRHSDQSRDLLGGTVRAGKRGIALVDRSPHRELNPA